MNQDDMPRRRTTVSGLPEQAEWALVTMRRKGGNGFRKDLLTPYMSKKLVDMGLITDGRVSGGRNVVTLTNAGYVAIRKVSDEAHK
jgi:hypothetical protein